MTETDHHNNFAFSAPATELVTVAAEYCKALEGQDFKKPVHFNDVMRNLLSMIYLKMSLLPQVPDVQGFNESRVTEHDYEYIRARVKRYAGAEDDYLDVFVEDFKYSDRPILRTISEDMADVYQALRELVETFRGGFEEAMMAGLREVQEEFRLHWGQRALNALKALHDIRFGETGTPEEHDF